MSNIRKIYAFNFFWLFSVLMPILYPYYASLGINMHQFFQLQAAFGLTVAFLDIPMGHLSDRFGRKLSIVLGAAFSGLGYIVLFYSTTFTGLLIHEVLLGVALSFISGADIAILYDSLPAQSSRKQFWQVLGRAQLGYATGEAAGALLCGLIVAYSYQNVVLAQVIISWLPFLVALTLTEPRQVNRPVYDWNNVKKMWRHLLLDDKMIKCLSWNFVMWLVSTYVIIWLVQRYWQDNQIPLAYFGVLWAVCNLVMGVSAFSSHALEKRFRAHELIHGVAILCCLGYALMSVLGGWWGAAAALTIYAARGINNVVSRDILNLRVPSELRATANSILNFIFRLIFSTVGPAIGYSIDHVGLRYTLMGLGFVFLAGYLFITRPLLKMLKDV